MYCRQRDEVQKETFVDGVKSLLRQHPGQERGGISWGKERNPWGRGECPGRTHIRTQICV